MVVEVAAAGLGLIDLSCPDRASISYHFLAKCPPLSSGHFNDEASKLSFAPFSAANMAKVSVFAQGRAAAITEAAD